MADNYRRTTTADVDVESVQWTIKFADSGDNEGKVVAYLYAPGLQRTEFLLADAVGGVTKANVLKQALKATTVAEALRQGLVQVT